MAVIKQQKERQSLTGLKYPGQYIIRIKSGKQKVPGL